MMRARVDPEQCVACGLCVEICPEVFSLADEVAVAADEVPPEVEERVREAAESCPVDAIEILD